MTAKEVFDKLKVKYEDEILEFIHEEPSDPFLVFSPSSLTDICLYLRDNDEMEFDYLVNLSGMDYIDKLGVVYHLYSTTQKHRLTFKILLEKTDPKLPSVENVWKTADWHEREAWDMYGIVFEGHHNLIRILTPYDWDGHPLLKDYKTPEEYHGIKVPY